MTQISHHKEGNFFEEWVHKVKDTYVVQTYFVDPNPNWNVFVTTEGRVDPEINMWDYQSYHPVDDNDRKWYIYDTPEEVN